MFINNKFNTFFGLNLTLVYTFPMCMAWRFHFPIRNYDFKEAGEKYKKFIKTKNKVYHKQLSNKLRTLKSNNAKEFWDSLGCNEKSKSASNNIPLQNFAEHFRELGNKQADANNSTYFDPILIDRSANDELNVNFTTKEIADVIKKQQSMWY